MCLVTTQKRVKIAKKDITVYKILTNALESPFQRFEYVLNRLYKTEIRSSLDGSYFCYDDQREYSNVKNKIYYNRGFHSFTDFKTANRHSDIYAVFKCIIPKGSRYYTNKLGYVVSNQLIITRRA